MIKEVVLGLVAASSLSCASAQVQKDESVKSTFDPSVCVERFDAEHEYQVEDSSVELGTSATVTYLTHDGKDAYYLTSAHVFSPPLEKITVFDIIGLYEAAKKPLPTDPKNAKVSYAKSHFTVEGKTLEILASDTALDVALVRFTHAKEPCPLLGAQPRMLEPIVIAGYGNGTLHGTQGVIADPRRSIANVSVIPGHSGSGVYAVAGDALYGIVSARASEGEYSHYVSAGSIRTWITKQGFAHLLK